MSLNIPATYTKGEPRTLIEVAEANKILKALTALETIRISPNGLGEVKVGEDGVIFDFAALKDAVVEMIQNAMNAGVRVGSDPTLAARVAHLESQVSGASFSIVCNTDGTITGTIHWGT